MIQATLDETECNYLLNSFFLTGNWKKIISVSNRQVDDSHVITISENQSDELRDILGKQLQLVGFDEQYNPTPEGEMLESLIDKFFIKRLGILMQESVNERQKHRYRNL